MQHVTSRHIFGCCLILSAIGPGCGKPEPAAAEPPEQAAARVFDLARKLEDERKTREAFAAYHQLVRHYPSTPHGKKAADRISQAQQAARRKAK